MILYYLICFINSHKFLFYVSNLNFSHLHRNYDNFLFSKGNYLFFSVLKKKKYAMYIKKILFYKLYILHEYD